MSLREPWATIRQRLLSSAAADFATLVKLAGLDPARHMRYSDWSGVDFGGSNLRGFDFTGARLIGCNFRGALISGARFEHALMHPRSYPLLGAKGTNLRDASDWVAYLQKWERAYDPPGDEHLPVGVVFQDAPFAPEMVVLPMGENGRLPLAVGCFAVTFHEGDFAELHREWYEHTRLKPPAGKRGGYHQRVSVTLSYARHYCRWLAAVTGKPYRLPSMFEWTDCYNADPTPGIFRRLETFTGLRREDFDHPWRIYDIVKEQEWCDAGLMPDAGKRKKRDIFGFRVARDLVL
jgi:Pentapeptide repeats (8 copies)